MSLPVYGTNSQVKAPQRLTLAVAAGKGGVGKSMLATHLCLGLKESGRRVGLLDADLYGPSCRHILPEQTMPQQSENTIYPAISYGISNISLAYFRPDNAPAAVRAPIANQMLTQFLTQVDWSGVDVLVIDFPPGTGDIQLTLCQKASINGAVLVCTPSELTLCDLRKAAHLFLQMSVPLLGVVENMSYVQMGSERSYVFGEGGGAKIAAEFGIPLLAQIPLLSEISFGCDRGSPASLQNPDIAALFNSLAQKVLDQSTSKPAHLLEQLSPTHFAITWESGQRTVHSFCDVQKKCPCITCKGNSHNVSSSVTASSIEPVGRYGVRIVFTSGCSNGLYDFSLLQDLAHAHTL